MLARLAMFLTIHVSVSCGQSKTPCEYQAETLIQVQVINSSPDNLIESAAAREDIQEGPWRCTLKIISSFVINLQLADINLQPGPYSKIVQVTFSFSSVVVTSFVTDKFLGS